MTTTGLATRIIVASTLSGKNTYTFSDTMTEEQVINAYLDDKIKIWRLYDADGNVCFVPKMWVKVTVVQSPLDVYVYSQKGDKQKILTDIIKERRKTLGKPFASIQLLEKAYQRHIS